MQHLAPALNTRQPPITSSEGLAIDRLQKPKTDAVARVLALKEKFGSQEQCEKPPVQQASQLKKWPDAVRGVPNALLRSSLFTVNKVREHFPKRELLASNSDIEVRFMGVRFNQTDLDVSQMLSHLARLQPLGSEVRFTAYSMLKALDRSTGKAQREQLKEEIARLRGGTIEVTWKKEKKTFIGGLIKAAYRDEATQQYVVILDENLLVLYDCGFSHINWEKRQALKSNLAKWLHGFYTSHVANPRYTYSVETIRSLCGSGTKELREFRRMLKAALADLQKVGAIKSWKFTGNDNVSVITFSTKSQAKHIKKKTIAARKSKKTTFSSSGNLF